MLININLIIPGRVSIISDFNSYSSNSTAYENYENSLRDSVLDFETIQDISEEDVEENVLREGVCNTVLQEYCGTLPRQPVQSVIVECVSHSEAWVWLCQRLNWTQVCARCDLHIELSPVEFSKKPTTSEYCEHTI